jgi:hypothetical protein
MIDLTLVLAAFLGAFGDEPAKAPQAPDPDRPALSASEIKALRDSNIFAPYGRKNAPPRSSRTTDRPRFEAPAAPKPKAPVVTGIFFDSKEQCFLVVLEDRNESSLKLFKEPKFLKAGDEVAGFKVGTVTAEKAAFLKGDVAKELAVGESLPGSETAPAAAATDDPEAAPLDTEAKVEVKPLDSEEKNRILEKMKKERGKKNRPSNDDQ